MMNIRLIGTAVIAALVAVGCGKKDGSSNAEKADVRPAGSAEKTGAKPAGSGEQVAEPNHVEAILALAKKSAEEDNNINFCGFFTGMSRYDAADLAAYYKLKEGEYTASALPGKAVSRLWFSLKGVRRITGGGNTIDELAQAVANRVGDLKGYNGNWEHKTIDGVVVTFSSKGLTIQNVQVDSQTPLATIEAARKDKVDMDAVEKAAAEEAARKARAAAEEAARKARAAAEEAARKARAAEEAEARRKEPIPFLIRDMIAIPGRGSKIGKYEVTQVQWQAVMGVNPSEYKNADNPVENVSWDDCQEFLKKLNALPSVKKSGLKFRLPFGREWEYACRAGSTGDYCKLADGTEITGKTLGEVAWCDGKAHPVGQKKPNAFGLYDMNGSVQEWCDDFGKYSWKNHEIRGGSWSHHYYTAGYRNEYPHFTRNGALGFRLAAD